MDVLTFLSSYVSATRDKGVGPVSGRVAMTKVILNVIGIFNFFVMGGGWDDID